MSLPWFRFYTEALNDPKVQKLRAQSFKFWVNCLCLAGIGGGQLPESMSDIAFAQRLVEDDVITFVDELKAAGLLDSKDGRLIPHNWADRQHKSDSSTARTQAYRDRKRHSDADVTVQNRTDTYAEKNRAYQKNRMPSVDTPTVSNLVEWNLFVTWASCGFRRDRENVLAVIDQRAPGFLDAEHERYMAQLDSGNRPDFALEFVPALLAHGFPLRTSKTKPILDAVASDYRLEIMQSYLETCSEDPSLCDPWPGFEDWKAQAQGLSLVPKKAA